MDTTQNITRDILKQILRFKIVLFLLLVVIVYGFVIWRANTLTKATPDQNTINAQSGANITPTINPTIINKVNQLQDNSVNVQALFNQARQNPFQE